MNMVIPNQGKVIWADMAFREDGPFENWILALYVNDYTPVDGSVYASFTKATFFGYADVEIARGDMDSAGLVGNVAVSVLPTVPTYECTGGSAQTAYGWFLYGEGSLICLAAQRFDTPRVMAANTIEKIDPFTLSLKTFT